MIGVRNFEGILGAETLRRPGFTAAALSLGDLLSLGALMIGPETFLSLSKTDALASYLPGPTTLFSFSLNLLPTNDRYY